MSKTTQPARAHRRNRLNRLLRKHFKLVIALGGIIISLSLAVKDRTQEHLRDFTSEADAIEEYSRLVMFQKKSSESISYIRSHLDEVRSRLIGNHGKLDEKLYADGNRFLESLSDVKDSFEIAEHIFALVPFDGKIKKDLDDAAKGVDDLSEEANQMRLAAMGDHWTEQEKEKRTRMMEDEVGLERIEATNLTRILMKQVDDRKADFRRKFFVSSLVCYALLALGFSVSLMGHLIGRDGEFPEIKLN